jgi:hypothetical protein
MAVQVIRPGVRDTPASPAEQNGRTIPDHPILELVGGPQRLRTAPPAPSAPLLTSDETLRALRLLAVDNLVDIVHLRETVAAQESRIKSLEGELQTWRERAVAEGDARHMEGLAAHRRERDLISVLHHQMLTTQAMNDELDHRRPLWRRRRKRAA